MRRVRPVAGAFLPAALLATIGTPTSAQPAPAQPVSPPAATAAPRSGTGLTAPTPVKDRVLVLGLLSKRTGETRSISLKPGQQARFLGLTVTARTCETTPPWERPKLSGAFVQVDEVIGKSPAKRVFSGWLYAESPSLNVMEHPRYDVWLKSCTMSFPDSGGGSPAAAGPSQPSIAKKSALQIKASDRISR